MIDATIDATEIRIRREDIGPLVDAIQHGLTGQHQTEHVEVATWRMLQRLATDMLLMAHLHALQNPAYAQAFQHYLAQHAPETTAQRRARGQQIMDDMAALYADKK